MRSCSQKSSSTQIVVPECAWSSLVSRPQILGSRSYFHFLNNIQYTTSHSAKAGQDFSPSSISTTSTLRTRPLRTPGVLLLRQLAKSSISKPCGRTSTIEWGFDACCGCIPSCVRLSAPWTAQKTVRGTGRIMVHGPQAARHGRPGVLGRRKRKQPTKEDRRGPPRRGPHEEGRGWRPPLPPSGVLRTPKNQKRMVTWIRMRVAP